MFINAVTDIEFWRDRLREFKDPIEAIIPNYEWHEVNPVHWKLMAKHIKVTDTVLDIGCGPGRISDWFSDELYVGMDFVPDFIKIAKEKHPNKKFVVADLLKELPFKENEFDWGICVSVKGTMFSGDKWDKNNTWEPIEAKLKKVCTKILILEYSRIYEEVIK